MKEVIEILKKKGRKFVLAYLVCAFVYALFELVYMPWLTVKFGYWMFIPLFPSIIVANFLGVYLYDYLGEDVLFMEFGSNWVQGENRKLESVAFNCSSVFKATNWGFFTFVKIPFVFIGYCITYLLKKVVNSKTLEKVRKSISKSKRLTFIALSIWPSPIASYLFFRKEVGEKSIDVFKCIVKGSVYCTVVWGGVLGLAWVAITQLIKLIN